MGDMFPKISEIMKNVKIFSEEVSGVNVYTSLMFVVYNYIHRFMTENVENPTKCQTEAEVQIFI